MHRVCLSRAGPAAWGIPGKWDQGDPAVGIALIFGSVLILVACPSGQPPRESAARLRPQGR